MKEDVDIILSIPIFEGMVDTIAWHADAKGCFSVKLAYMLATRKRDHLRNADTSSSTTQQGENVWKSICGLRVTNKIKMFLWRLTHNSHPVKANIARHVIKLDTICPMCWRLDEDGGHLFFQMQKC